jgi:hypothetical protein
MRRTCKRLIIRDGIDTIQAYLTLTAHKCRPSASLARLQDCGSAEKAEALERGGFWELTSFPPTSENKF